LDLTDLHGKLEGIRDALENNENKLVNDEDPAKKMSLVIILDSNSHLTRFESSKPASV
jgi:hypothetical protein